MGPAAGVIRCERLLLTFAFRTFALFEQKWAGRRLFWQVFVRHADFPVMRAFPFIE